MTDILKVSKLLSNGRLQGFLLRYITSSYLNWLQNCELLNLEVQKKCLEKVHFTTQIIIIQALFWTFRFNRSQFQCQLRQERVIYLKRTPYNVSFERSFETGRISVMKGYRRVLVKVVLFQLRGCGHSQDDATPNFFADSKCPI